MATVQLKLENVQIALSTLLVAKPFKNTPPRYSATFQVVKGSAQEKALWKAIEEAAKLEWGKKADAKLEEFKHVKQQFCVQDGDKSHFEPSHGTWRITAHRHEKHGAPELRTRKNTPITQEGVIYDGCYVNADLDIWTQDGENAGIRCGLVGVQFVGDGPAFGGARKGSSFGSLETDDDEV